MSAVADFERAFAEYCGARYCIALCNGTATLHTALVALGVKPGDQVATTPLTMSATTIAILQAGAVPVFCDVDHDTWLMDLWSLCDSDLVRIPVDLYGLHVHYPNDAFRLVVDDAAQTLRPHIGGKDGGVGRAWGHFTSWSFQASKILALGEGGMLATNDQELAVRAREFSSLGYRMAADQPRISKAVLKDPRYERHHTLGWNYRMSSIVAREGLDRFDPHLMTVAPWMTPDGAKADRRDCAALYRDAVAGCSWIKPQHTPEGWGHDHWAFAAALESADLWHPFADAIERHGGARPFAAWRLSYMEPALVHLAEPGTCPVAENLQPRIVAGQTNDIESARRNAQAWHLAIADIGGAR